MRRSVVVGAALCALLAGCGLPSRTGVTIDGEAPLGTASTGKSGVRLPSPNDARSPTELVQLYLRAAADGPGSAAERLQSFITADSTWQPRPTLTVVRQVGEASVTPYQDRDAVKVTLQPVGVLTPEGSVTEATGATTRTIEFNVVANPGTGREEDRPQWQISEPPRDMYVLADIFGESGIYQPYPIYYWDGAGKTLVADYRYLSSTLPGDRIPTELVNMLLSKPSDWLTPTRGVRTLPDEIRLRGKLVIDRGRMIVDLAGTAATVQDLQQFAIQLAWTLRKTHDGLIELRIEGTERLTIRASDYPKADPAWDVLRSPEKFCIVGTVVRYRCREDGQLRVLAAGANQGVTAAAVARNEQDAALVRSEAGGSRLWLGRIEPGRQQPVYLRTDLGAPTMSRPTWLPSGSAEPQGLVAAGGKLYRFVSGRSRVVELTTGDVRSVTAVAVAPDGRRIALVAGGRAYVAVLVVTGDNVSVGPPRRLPSKLPVVSGVGWSRADSLILLGGDGPASTILEITLSGLNEDRVLNLGDLAVRTLATYPDNPGDGLARGRILIEADIAQEVSGSPQPMVYQTTSSPAPTGAAAKPVAPFYID